MGLSLSTVECHRAQAGCAGHTWESGVLVVLDQALISRGDDLRHRALLLPSGQAKPSAQRLVGHLFAQHVLRTHNADRHGTRSPRLGHGTTGRGITTIVRWSGQNSGAGSYLHLSRFHHGRCHRFSPKCQSAASRSARRSLPRQVAVNKAIHRYSWTRVRDFHQVETPRQQGEAPPISKSW